MTEFVFPRMGYGAMRLAGPNVFGPPRDRAAALAVPAVPGDLADGAVLGAGRTAGVGIRHLGVSAVSDAQLTAAQRIAPVVTVQNGVLMIRWWTAARRRGLRTCRSFRWAVSHLCSRRR